MDINVESLSQTLVPQIVAGIEARLLAWLKQQRPPSGRESMLTPSQSAALCRCRAETVRTAIATGRLPAVRLTRVRGGHGGFLISRVDLDLWLSQGRPCA